MKPCSVCHESKPLSEYHKNASNKDGHQYHCKACQSKRAAELYRKGGYYKPELSKRWKAENHGRGLCYRARARANKSGIIYSLTPEDEDRINDIVMHGVCELTDMPFAIGNGRTWDSPSIDRIDSSQGYEPGNVRVVITGMNQAMGNWGLDITVEFMKAAIRKLEQSA